MFICFGNYRLLPWWKTWTYCNGVMAYMSYYDTITITKIDWQPMFHVWQKASDNRLNELLSCSASFFQIHNYLDTTHGTMKECISIETCKTNMQIKERINRFLDVVARHAKNNTVLEYIITNFEKIKPR